MPRQPQPRTSRDRPRESLGTSSIASVLASDLCCGCGVCAGLCPAQCLAMTLDNTGRYVPVRSGDCTNCGQCLAVCPFARDASLFDPADCLGPLASAYVGHSDVNDERSLAASGGLATRLLSAVLEKRLVDRVVAVCPTGERADWFRPALLNEPGELRQAMGSKYCPVEFSQVVREILTHDERFAIICLPCVARALRKAMAVRPLLRERISYLFAVTCGHNNTQQYSIFLARRAGIRPPFADLSYRIKGVRASAYDFGFQVKDTADRASEVVWFQDTPATLWSRRIFGLNSCFFCSDVFGQEADATFMDAWLPEYSGDLRGTSIVIARRAEAAQLVDEQRKVGNVVLEPLAADRVVQSQIGAIRHKHRQVDALIRANHLLTKGLYTPSRPSSLTKHETQQALRTFRRQRRFATWSRQVYSLSASGDVANWRHAVFSVSLDALLSLEKVAGEISKRLSQVRARAGRFYRRHRRPV